MKKTILTVLLLLVTLAGFSQLDEKVGIGVRLRLDSARGYTLPAVITVIPNSPAQTAGLQEQDYILKVNDVSTRDVALTEIVDKIVGEEGTEVRLVIERGGTTRNYAIKRQKYKYAASFYEPAVKDNEFCTALSTLMNDAAYDFDHTRDSTRYTDDDGAFSRRHYESKVQVPGAEKTEMVGSFGITCEISLGTFSNEDEVNSAGESLVQKLQTCFPDYYYEPVIRESGNKVQIGRKFSDGFESAIIELFPSESKTDHTYKLILRINGGKPTRYYTVSTAPQDNPFATPLRTIYDDVPHDYENVKGTKHETEGVWYSSAWYEVNTLPAGAHDCSITEGSLTGGGCKCRFYLGEDRDEGVKAYNKLYEVIRDGLGSEFVHTFEKPYLDMNLPRDTEAVIIFGRKKEKSYESIPLIALVFYKETDTQYAVNILAYDFGF